MKSLLGYARNIYHAYVSDPRKVQTSIELVLIVSEPNQQYVGASLTRVEEVETLRVGLLPESARELAQALLGYADEADEQTEEISGMKKG